MTRIVCMLMWLTLFLLTSMCMCLSQLPPPYRGFYPPLFGDAWWTALDSCTTLQVHEMAHSTRFVTPVFGL